jgi:hypothetical protein
MRIHAQLRLEMHNSKLLFKKMGNIHIKLRSRITNYKTLI